MDASFGATSGPGFTLNISRSGEAFAKRLASTARFFSRGTGQ